MLYNNIVGHVGYDISEDEIIEAFVSENDKDFVRNWVVARCDPYKDPIPEIPAEVVLETAAVYIRAYETMANLATRSGVEGTARMNIRTPLMQLSKKAIIELGLSMDVDYSLTSSCYDPAPGGSACGRCDACQLRLRGFEQAGTEDPAEYRP